MKRDDLYDQNDDESFKITNEDIMGDELLNAPSLPRVPNEYRINLDHIGWDGYEVEERFDGDERLLIVRKDTNNND